MEVKNKIAALLLAFVLVISSVIPSFAVNDESFYTDRGYVDSAVWPIEDVVEEQSDYIDDKDAIAITLNEEFEEDESKLDSVFLRMYSEPSLKLSIKDYPAGEYKIDNNVNSIVLQIPEANLNSGNSVVEFPLNINPNGALSRGNSPTVLNIRDDNTDEIIGKIEFDFEGTGRVTYSLNEDYDGLSIKVLKNEYLLNIVGDRDELSILSGDDIVSFAKYAFRTNPSGTIGNVNIANNEKVQNFDIEKVDNRKLGIAKIEVLSVSEGIKYKDETVSVGDLIFNLEEEEYPTDGKFEFSIDDGYGSIRIRITDLAGNVEDKTLNLGYNEPPVADPNNFTIRQKQEVEETKDGDYLVKTFTLTGGKKENYPPTITITEDMITKPSGISEGNTFELDLSSGEGLKYEREENGNYKLKESVTIKVDIDPETGIGTYKIPVSKMPVNLGEYKGKYVSSKVIVDYQAVDEEKNLILDEEGEPIIYTKENISNNMTFGVAMVTKYQMDSRIVNGKKITSWVLLINNETLKPIGATYLKDNFKVGELVDNSLQYAIADKKIEPSNLNSELSALTFNGLEKETGLVPYFKNEGTEFEIFFGDTETVVEDAGTAIDGVKNIFDGYELYSDVEEYKLKHGPDHYPDYGPVTKNPHEVPYTNLARDYGTAIRTQIADYEQEGIYEFQKPTSGVPLVIRYELESEITDNAEKNDIEFKYYKEMPSFDIIEPIKGDSDAPVQLIPKAGELSGDNTSESEDLNKIYKEAKASLIDDKVDSTIVHHGILANIEGVPVDTLEVIDLYSAFNGITNIDSIEVYEIDSTLLKFKLEEFKELEGNSSLEGMALYKAFIIQNLKALDSDFIKIETVATNDATNKRVNIDINNSKASKSYLVFLDTYADGKLGNSSRQNNAEVKYGNYVGRINHVVNFTPILTKSVEDIVGSDKTKKYTLTLDLEKFKVPSDVNSFEIKDTITGINNNYMKYGEFKKVNEDDNYTFKTNIDDKNNLTIQIEKIDTNGSFPDKLQISYVVTFDIAKIFNGSTGVRRVDNTANLKILYDNPSRTVTDTSVNSTNISTYDIWSVKPFFNVEIDKEVEDGDTLSGFEFTIKNSKDEENTLYTDENGKLVFKLNYYNLDYSITEGYRVDDYLEVDEIKFKAKVENGNKIIFDDNVLREDVVEVIGIKDKDGNIVVEYPAGDSQRTSGQYTIEDEQTIVLRVVNKKVDSHNVSFKKIDASKRALSGAEFKLQKYNAGSGAYEDFGEKIVSDTNGIVRFENLPNGKYRLIETKAPSGYKLSNSPIEFELSKRDPIDVELEDVVNVKEDENPNWIIDGGIIWGGPELNKKDHFAYMIGYPDGRVMPEGKITRAEVSTIFFRMLTDSSRDKYWSSTSGYSDVKIEDWYNNAISTLSNAKVINGYPEGDFKPNANITRGEFATMVSRFLTDEKVLTNKTFSDVKGNWAEEAIVKLASRGLIAGYEDGSFKPNREITRAEAATLINSVLERTPHKDHLLEKMIKWEDNMDVSAWYYAQIQEATNSHDYTRMSDRNIEKWERLLPVRDWAAFEREWSNSKSATNPGEVVK